MLLLSAFIELCSEFDVHFIVDTPDNAIAGDSWKRIVGHVEQCPQRHFSSDWSSVKRDGGHAKAELS